MTAEEEHAGKVVACPGCNGKFQIPQLPPANVAPVAQAGPKMLTAPATTAAPATTSASSPASATTKVARDGWKEDDHANVNFALSLGYGVLIS
ncbi:MAG: hypothetical protein RL117_1969, partial [Verrucomicrobiota bacterium]